MSQYANYSELSQNYDNTRIPVGVDHLLNCFRSTMTPLENQVLLECGCGTGNYLQALCPHVKSVTGIDYSEGMLEQARAKLGDRANLNCGSILQMPYVDECFDSILCNQVLHHLEAGPGANEDAADWEDCQFRNVRKFLHEACRVLKPGGAFVINSTTHRQLFDGFWWAELIPEAVARVRWRLPDAEPLEQFLNDAGFVVESVTPDRDGVLQGPAYLNPRGPLDEQWRDGDSTWAITSEAELQVAQERVRKMSLEQTADDWLAERELLRKAVGQTTFFCARKPSSPDHNRSKGG